jgi:Ca-activated chloride channel homolog
MCRRDKRPMSKCVALVMVVLALLVAAPPTLADGVIIPIAPPDIPVTEVQNLTIRYHHVDVRIDGPIAVTHVDQVFVNEARYPIEGTYMFPLPENASISQFDMIVDGKRLEGELLGRDEARQIYEEIVRRQLDPALLEYVGRGAFKASIFPIPAGGERRIEIEYTQVLEADNGLVHYSYPLDTERFSARPIEEVAISVEIRSESGLRAIYSPSHDVMVSREGSNRAQVGYEESYTLPDHDFELYFSTSEDPFGLNLLSYKPAGEDGYFLLLVSPEMAARQQEIVERDVLLVLDVSGSMEGEKVRQAKSALTHILNHLNSGDRFNVIDFSTGVRSFDRELAPAERRQEAIRYVDRLTARGGTDINRALLEALSYGEDSSRPQVVIFLTDGLPTEGVTEIDQIIANVAEEAGSHTRMFAFGVGYDVNTVLLDSIAQAHRGTSTYVVPGENIEEKVSAFFAKISTPLLSSPTLDFYDVHVEETYPYPLPDFFMGTQLVLTGRYRQGGATTVALAGEVNGRQERYTYDGVRFTRSGGDAFIARLWATRKVGYLLNQIKLHGESRELIDELVDLSIRYGIITPYTSFLVEEDDVLTEAGRERLVEREVLSATQQPAPAMGRGAVEKSMAAQELSDTNVLAPPASSPSARQEVRHVGDRVFVRQGDVWTDTLYDAGRLSTVDVQFGSPAYFELLDRYPASGRYLSVGSQVIVVLDGMAYRVAGEGVAELPAPAHTPTGESSPDGESWQKSFLRWVQSLLD